MPRPESKDRFPRLWVYTMERAKPTTKDRVEVQHALTIAIREIKNGYIYQGIIIDNWADRIIPLPQRAGWSSIVGAVECRGRNPDLIIVANIRTTFRGIDDLHDALSQRLVEVAWHRPTRNLSDTVDTRHPCWRHQRLQIQAVLKMARDFEPFKFHPAMGINLPWIRPIFQSMDRQWSDAKIAGHLNSKGLDCPNRLGEVRPRWTPKDVEYWRESFRQWKRTWWFEKERNEGLRFAPSGHAADGRPGPAGDGAADTGTAPGGRPEDDHSQEDGSGI